MNTLSYPWLSSKGAKTWTEEAVYWQQLAHKVYKSMWTVTSLTMLGTFIGFWNGQLWMRYLTAIAGILTGLTSIVFAINYIERRIFLWKTRPPLYLKGEELIHIPENEIQIFLMRGPSPEWIMISSLVVIVILLIPLFRPDVILWLIEQQKH